MVYLFSRSLGESLWNGTTVKDKLHDEKGNNNDAHFFKFWEKESQEGQDSTNIFLKSLSNDVLHLHGLYLDFEI